MHRSVQNRNRSLPMNGNCGNGLESSSNDSWENTPRKMKYAQRYKVSWEAGRPWLKLVKDSAFCNLCKKRLDNNISNLNRHAASRRHRNKRAELPQQRDEQELVEKQDALGEDSQIEASLEELLKFHSPECVAEAKEPLDIDDNTVVQEIPEQRTRSYTTRSINGLKKRRLSNNVRTQHRSTEGLSKITNDNLYLEDNIPAVHEFDAFCSSIAIQLKKMPLRNALICQGKLQQIMTTERLSLLSAEDPLTLHPPQSLTRSSRRK